MTVRELADRVFQERKTALTKADRQTAIVATEQLGPDDEAAVRRVVGEAGYQGGEYEVMVKEVSARVVGLIEGLADNTPVTGGD